MRRFVGILRMEHSRNVGLGDQRGQRRVVAPVEFDRRDGKTARRRPFPGHPEEPAERIDIADVQAMEERVEQVNLGEIHPDPQR